MLKVYGSKNCPDCRNLKLNFLKYGIEFEEIEILDSLKNLKEFLHYRDNNKEVFERLIEIGDIGIEQVTDGLLQAASAAGALEANLASVY